MVGNGEHAESPEPTRITRTAPRNNAQLGIEQFFKNSAYWINLILTQFHSNLILRGWDNENLAEIKIDYRS